METETPASKTEPPADGSAGASAPNPRRAGILLHPTSLPGPYGIGDLGPAAGAFLDWAASGGQRLWQVLPLNPTGYGDSPYSALSSFAGNPLLISPEVMVREGLVEEADLERLPRNAGPKVDFPAVGAAKAGLLRASFERFRSAPPAGLAEAFELFGSVAANAAWLDDWCLFVALRARFEGRPWPDWDAGLARREQAALATARRELEDEIAFHRYVQFLFFRQWQELRDKARALDIEIMGDLPIYVPLDSADVWSRQDLFDLDGDGRPLALSGVPPDAFSSDGQLWGTPVYRWDRHREEGFRWWIDRLRSSFRFADRVRLDHFRGFESYWRVPAGAATAIDGKWEPGPGLALFEAITKELGEARLVAEDLGVITPEVEALLDASGLPRMKVLQFAFSEPDSKHLPHHHLPHAVTYTGTHDNDTARGWFSTLGDEERWRVRDYLGFEGGGVEWALIRAAYTSVAEGAVVPLQDVLGLGGEARMNRPGSESGNWSWRVREEEIREGLSARLRRLAELSGRLSSAAQPPP